MTAVYVVTNEIPVKRPTVVYIVSNRDNYAKSQFKVGIHVGGAHAGAEIVASYVEQLIDPKIHLFKTCDYPDEVKRGVLLHFDKERVVGVNGYKSEWICASLAQLEHEVDKVIRLTQSKFASAIREQLKARSS